MDKKILEANVLINEMIAEGIWHMRMHAEEAAETAHPGQFINLYPKADRLILPRPFGIAGADRAMGTIDIIYEVVGAGTREFSGYSRGDKARITTPLGNGFDISEVLEKKDDTEGEKPPAVLVAGGVGMAPVLFLAETLRESGAEATVVLGFRKEIFLKSRFEEIGCRVLAATEVPDEHAFLGTVIDCMEANQISSGDYFACGPRGMLEAVDKYVKADCGDDRLQVSLEARMGCGYGVCVGCSVDILDSDGSRVHRKVCTDGPVFSGNEVVWHG